MSRIVELEKLTEYLRVIEAEIGVKLASFALGCIEASAVGKSIKPKHHIHSSSD